MNKEDIIMSITEAIENGYGYERTIDRLVKNYGIPDLELSRIYEAMNEHVWPEDDQYVRFSNIIASILDGDKPSEKPIVKVGLLFIGAGIDDEILDRFLNECEKHIGTKEYWIEPMQDYLIVTSSNLRLPVDRDNRESLATQLIVGNAISLGDYAGTRYTSGEIYNGYGSSDIEVVVGNSGRMVVTKNKDYYLIMVHDSCEKVNN